MRLQPYLRRLFLATFVLFVANKFVLRPFVLEHDLGPLWVILVGSLPNTCEAVFGVTILSAFAMFSKRRNSPRFDHVRDLVVYALATLAAGIYVLTQEFKLHNFGGNNVYDPYDVVASVVGLVGMFLLVSRYGVLDGEDSGSELERQHREGYLGHPVEPGEFDVWEEEAVGVDSPSERQEDP